MPLSDDEQRSLDQIERALYEQDPGLAASLGGWPDLRGHRTRLAVGVLALLAGLALLIAGVAAAIIMVGVTGFVVMLVGATLAQQAFTRPAAGFDDPPRPRR